MSPAVFFLSLLACSPFDAPSEPDNPQVAPTPEHPAPPVNDPADAALPDVVWITLDTTRADHLSTYGYFRETAPRLAALASESIVFERMVVPMATTLPTHTSLFTGTYPTEHGILANIEHRGRKFVPSESLRPLASWLADLGYQTGGFVSAAPLNRASGVDQGFQTYTTPPGKRPQRDGSATADDAIGWISSTADTPLFLWVHLYDPHNPFTPPEAYRSMFKREDALTEWMAERKVEKVTQRPTGEVVRALRSINLYDAEIRYMDDQVARVLDALDARGRLDNTLIVVAGDHGEGLNQHGQPGHGLVWHEQLHAPLFMKAPGTTPQRVQGTVSAVDVLPTALGLVDLPGTAELLAQVSGVDALTPDALSDRPVLSQTSERQLMFGRPMTYTLTDDTWKCSWAEGEPVKLWRHADDPHELSEAADKYPDEAVACETRLRETLAAQKARAVALGSGKTSEMTDEERAALEALGYLDDDAPGGH